MEATKQRPEIPEKSNVPAGTSIRQDHGFPELQLNLALLLRASLLRFGSAAPRAAQAQRFGTPPMSRHPFSRPRLHPSFGLALLAPGLALAQGQKLNGPLPTPGSGDVLSAQVSTDGARAVYRAVHFLPGGDSARTLYSAPLGGGSPVVLNTPDSALHDVLDFALASAGGLVVYRVERASPSAIELYSAPVDGSSASVKLNAPLGAGGEVSEFLVSPDGDRVVFLANQASGQPLQLFGAPTDGSAAAVELDGALTPAFALNPGVPRFLVAGNARVVFMVDALADERRELFSAPLDGSAPPIQLTGPIFSSAEQYMAQNPFEFRVSSDGARVVYRSDELVPPRDELLSVPTDASAAPVRLNTPSLAGQNFGGVFEITPDSATVVFSSGASLYRVPIDAVAAPTALDPTGSDVVISILISPNGSRVVFKRWGQDGTGRVYSVPLAGGTGVQISGSGGQPGIVMIGLGGARVLYGSSPPASGQTTLYSVPIAGGAAPVALNGSLLVNTYSYSGTGLQLAPDGIGVIFAAVTALGQPVELYGVPIFGGTAPVKLCAAQTTLSDVKDYAISPSSLEIVYLADQDTDEVVELYQRSVGSSTPAIKLNDAFQAGPIVGDVEWSAIAPGGGHVIYVANQDVSTQDELYSVSLATGGPPVKLNAPLPEGGNVVLNLMHETTPVITPDGSRVAFVASRSDGSGYALYSAPIDGGGPVVELAPGVGLSGASSLLLTAAGAEVVFQGYDTTTRLLRVRVDGSAPPTAIESLASSQSFIEYRLDPASSRVVYLATASGGYRLYSVPLDGSQSEVMLSPSFIVTASVLEGFQISPDSARVVFRSPSGTSALRELFSAPIDGSAPAVKLNGALVTNGGTQWSFAISPDSASVVYCTDQESSRTELYVVPIGGGTPLKLNHTVTGGAGIELEFGISPDGERVVYRRRPHLYSVPIDRSQEPIQLSQTVTHIGVRDFRFLPGGHSLVYRSDPVTDGEWNYYRVPVAGGAAPLLLNDPAFPAAESSAGPSFEITPDGEWLLYSTDRLTNGYNLRAAATMPGSAASFRVNASLPADASVFEYAASSEGSQVIYRADQDVYGVFELYRSFLPDTRAHPHKRFP